MVPVIYVYNQPYVFHASYGFVSYIFAKFHVEMKGKVLIIGKEFTPGGNDID